MGKLSPVGVGFGDQLIGNIKFQVVTVRADQGFSEADGFIPDSPMKSGLENNFFGRIALGFVETSCRLGFAENVGDAVVADAIAGTEIRVSVVVEGTPANATSVLRVGR